MKLLLFAFLTFSRLLMANEEIADDSRASQINIKLEALKALAPERFAREVEEYRKEIERFINHKKRVCDGEFSTMVIEQDSAQAGPVNESNEGQFLKKLSKREKKLCYIEMKSLQVTFIGNMFEARRKYLEYLHKNRINELEAAKERRIKAIQNQFNVINRR